ncbi:MAG: 6-hydroxymethylpterin diphosphokinase MptE-like protein, partial [Phycisphaerae bacterium]
MDGPTITSPTIARSVPPAEPASGEHHLFVRNMAALYRKDPQLAQRIDEIPDADRLPLEPTRSGHLTTRFQTRVGGIYLHSRYDPVAEADKLIDPVEINDKFCLVVFGFGLGYHVQALHKRLKGDAMIIVIEPSLPLLSTAFSCRDFSDVINSGRLVLLDELNKAVVHEKLKPHNTLMMLGAQFVMHPPSGQIAGELHTEARKLITDLIAYSRMTLLTLVGNATITCHNIAHNLPRYLATPPINILRDRFKGCPGIIISGGPSLRRNIDLLAEAKGRAVLCGVQTTFKPLLTRGIVPDFVTSLDFHAMSKQFFSGLNNLHDVHLVAEPKVNWEVLDQFDGPVSLLYSPFAAELISEELARRDGLQAGATVAHLAFYLAVYMGCDPIIFVGQDLAFTGHCFYMPGVEIHH